MIPYCRDPKQTIPASSVKIIGIGGAGINMLERIALDGIEGAELLALNTDIRTLGSCMAPGKIQLGANLTKGLGSGGDPDIGHQAVLEAEQPLRAAIKDRRIVFLCVGLGGGTGSGAAPIVTRIAREEGAFVVVFATMPFAFEGRRRRDQAESALNELAVLSNALVTFDNNRMGELVLAKQGIHEAFAAADHMIREAIMAVLRLVIRPGLIHVGLDDLMSALRTTRSRCLFGSGSATGRDRAAKALRIALASPLLDQGSLLNEAQTVVVHLSGGESLTLFEVELLMQNLGKNIPEKAHVLFGAAIDPAMGDSLSVTLISALPEDTLAMTSRDSLSRSADQDSPLLNPSQGFTPTDGPEPVVEAPPTPDAGLISTNSPPSNPAVAAFSPAGLFDDTPFAGTAAPVEAKQGGDGDDFALFDSIPAGPVEKPSVMVAEFVAVTDDDGPGLENLPDAMPVEHAGDDIKTAGISGQDHDALSSTLPPRRAPGAAPWTIAQGPREQGPREQQPDPAATPDSDAPELPLMEAPKLKLGVKTAGTQSELSLDSAPRGRFEGESPNVYGGEDLDLPPFLRKKK